VIDDPYCYPGTQVLINLQDHTDENNLRSFEFAMTTERFGEPLPEGRLSVKHFLAVHRHLFQDVYAWAGRPRTVRMAKGQSHFCFPENIQPELKRLFAKLRADRFLRDLPPADFAQKAASFLADLNAIHAFRDGNGRAQMAFFTILAARAGHPLRLDRIEPAPFLAAMIASFRGDEAPLVAQIERLIDGPLLKPPGTASFVG
jgi:cell filamentation protein